MSVRFFRHMLNQINLTGNEDRVVADCPLPSECTQNNVWGEVHMMNNDGFFTDGAVVYGCDGFVVQHPDPDTPDSVDDIWGRMIEFDKAIANAAFDIDTASVSSQPHFEAGEPNINSLLDEHAYNDDNHWYKRRKILSFANSPTGFHWVTGGVSTYSPRDMFKVRSRRNITADVPSMSLVGMTMPGLSGTTSSVPNGPGSEAEWIQMKYLEVVLEQAWMFLVGLVEAGAESPWEDAAILVGHLLEPAPFEEDAASWFTDEFRIWSTWTFDVTVPGRRDFNVISAE